MTKKTPLLNELHKLILAHDNDPDAILAKTRRLLENARMLDWLCKSAQSPSPSPSPEEGAALWALIGRLDAAPEHPAQSALNAHAQALGLMQQMLRQTLEWVRDFPKQGTLYAALLESTYFSAEAPTEDALLSTFHIERSTFYLRKTEATLLYGYLFYHLTLAKIDAKCA